MIHILVALLFGLSAQAKPTPSHPGPLRPRVQLALSRLGYGARPSDIEGITTEKKLRAWIDSQISPPAEDPKHSLDVDLTKHELLTLSLEELFQKYNKEAATDDPAFKPDQILKSWSSAKVIRAVESPHPFSERLADMWFNHFNVDQRKGKLRWSFGAFERDAIRPYMFGHFYDLLRATARHPAMLFYLDNHLNRADTKKKQGINENYARELMELHTLGVGGGYTQQDVGEVARILTGWSIKDDSQFEFREKIHDFGVKRVMQWAFPEGQGEAEGDRLLLLLARHPATAKRIARMVVENFVAQPAPETLVNKLAAIYTATDGDLRALYRAVVDSKEFWTPGSTRIKDHFTWTVSLIRALDGEVLWQNDLVKQINEFGEPLYQCSPPTGYTHRPEDLINSGSLLSRLNLALKLAANRIDGVYVTVPRPPRLKTDTQILDFVQNNLGLADVTPATRAALLDELRHEPWATPRGEVRPFVLARVTGLLLASPEFQRY